MAHSVQKSALPRLLKTGNPEAMTFAIELAGKGGRNDRYEAMRMLADSGTPKAFEALTAIAGKSHGMTRVQSLDFDDHPFRLTRAPQACGLCGARDSYLDEVVMDDRGGRLFVCSDTDYCAGRQSMRQDEDAAA